MDFRGAVRPVDDEQPPSRTPPAAAVLVVVVLAGLALLSVSPGPGVEEPSETDLSPLPPPLTTTTGVVTASCVFGGRLPDGTAFTVRCRADSPPPLEGITAQLMIDVGEEQPLAVAFEPGAQPRSFTGQVLRIPTGDWTAVIVFPPSMLSSFGRPTLNQAITVPLTSQYPVLGLSPPFRWATDEEGVVPMEVRYRGLAIRRGCGEGALACNPTRAVQVVSRGWTGGRVWLEAVAPRPPTDPYWIPPGPVRSTLVDLVWTGDRMIVWPRDSSLAAAFDPRTSNWEVLPRSPFAEGAITHAVWDGRRMLVVGEAAVAAYQDGAWEVVGPGLPYLVLLTEVGGDPVAWAGGGIYRFTGGEWEWLEEPGFGSPAELKGRIYDVDGRIVAVGLVGNRCDGRRVAEWTGEEWRPWPPIDLSTPERRDCALANQAAVVDGRLMLWADAEHPAFAYDPQRGIWEPVQSPPLEADRSPSGAVPMGPGRILIPQFDHAAYFDGETWTVSALPGWTTDRHVVWTGREVISWGMTFASGIDAWRWWPPVR